MVTVGGRDNHLLSTHFLKSTNVAPGEALEDVLVTGFTNALTTAVCPITQDAKVNPGFFQDARCSPGNPLDTGVIFRDTAGEVQYLGSLGIGLHIKVFCPIGSFIFRFA